MRKIMTELFGSVRSFTLTEILIVVVIVALLAVLALPMFVKTIEKAKVGEAISNLNLIRAGQKIYYLEYGYFAGTYLGEDPIEKLKIEDPNDASSRYFYYEITSIAGDTSDFTAQATRGGDGAQPTVSPYDDDVYTIQKGGEIDGPLI